MLYRHTGTGRLIEVNSTLSGAWEPVGSQAAERLPQTEEKPARKRKTAEKAVKDVERK